MILSAILHGLEILGILIAASLLTGLLIKGVRSYRSRSQQLDSTTSLETEEADPPPPWYKNNWIIVGIGSVILLLMIGLEMPWMFRLVWAWRVYVTFIVVMTALYVWLGYEEKAKKKDKKDKKKDDEVVKGAGGKITKKILCSTVGWFLFIGIFYPWIATVVQIVCEDKENTTKASKATSGITSVAVPATGEWSEEVFLPKTKFPQSGSVIPAGGSVEVSVQNSPKIVRLSPGETAESKLAELGDLEGRPLKFRVVKPGQEVIVVIKWQVLGT